MRKTVSTIAFAALVASSGAFAQSATTDNTQTTTASQEPVQKGGLRNEIVGLKPQLGFLQYTDGAGDTATRGAAGLQLDMNLVPAGSSASSSGLYVGPQTGALFSHIGGTGANFFGSGDNGAGGNAIIIPANLKAGWTFGDAFRMSGHGGANVVYQSIVDQMNLGQNGSFGSEKWSVVPNVGAEAEFGLTPAFTISLRPDWTIAPNNDAFTGTLLLGIALG